MFHTNGNGQTHETDDATTMGVFGFIVRATDRAQKELDASDARVQAAMDEWDGTLNADDISKLCLALVAASEKAFSVAMDSMGSGEFLDNMNSAKTVMEDCRILNAKLSKVLATHPHTMNITPF